MGLKKSLKRLGKNVKAIAKKRGRQALSAVSKGAPIVGGLIAGPVGAGLGTLVGGAAALPGSSKDGARRGRLKTAGLFGAGSILGSGLINLAGGAGLTDSPLGVIGKFLGIGQPATQEPGGWNPEGAEEMELNRQYDELFGESGGMGGPGPGAGETLLDKLFSAVGLGSGGRIDERTGNDIPPRNDGRRTEDQERFRRQAENDGASTDPDSRARAEGMEKLTKYLFWGSLAAGGVYLVTRKKKAG